MKKTIGLILSCTLLILSLTGCTGNTPAVVSDGQEANFSPEHTAVPSLTTVQPAVVQPVVDDPIAVQTDAPTIAPEATLVPADIPDPTIAPTPTSSINYTYNMLTDTSFGFTFAYPSDWVNLPGKHTVCFREVVEDGDVPARVAVTKKTLTHTPKAATVLEQFQAYTQTVYQQYDEKTFELGELNQNAVFMGQQAFEITYLAYVGDVEVKGYLICCAVERSVYALHFSASYNDFAAMDSVLRRIRDSVTVVTE